MQVSLEKRGAIGVIWVDNPPVNAISHAVRAGLIRTLGEAIADADLDALVLACRGRTFIAGADIAEFATGPAPPILGEVVDRLAASSKLLVAALHGTAFGGGLEVALACHYRIATATTKVGLPEVKLGILPGAQGTQRLPRLAGVDFALRLIVSGDLVSAAEARDVGVIDRITDKDIAHAAVLYAESLLADAAPLRRTHEMGIDDSAYGDDYFAAFRKSVARRTRGMHAPERAIRAIETAVRKPFAEGVIFEREMIDAAFADPQSTAMQHVFFAERAAGKIPGIDKTPNLRPVASVGIVGAGTMGGGIAMNFANAGIPVNLLDLNDEALAAGLGIVRSNYEASARKGRLSNADVAERMSLIRGTTRYQDLADVDLVIEAVFENMTVKKDVFSALNATVRSDAILATNTSYLNIDEIASVVNAPERVLGMHFFSPANVMQLLEIVRAERTSRQVLATILKLAKTIRKAGVVAGVCRRFIGNRMLSGYAHEANMLMLEGAAPERIDQALYDFGMPMGVIAMTDLAGLDIGYRLRKQLDADDYDIRATWVHDQLVDMGRLGQKTGAGIYDYEPGSRTPIPSSVTRELIGQAAEKFAIEQREISDVEIVERCFYSLFNIGCDVLDEAVAYRASDIDIVYVYGYGFPVWRGGPMYWAEKSVGLATVLDRVREFAAVHGERFWRPSPLLERLVSEGTSLRSVTTD